MVITTHAIVFGCGKIFDNHYRDLLFSCFNNVLLVDPRLEDISFKQSLVLKAKTINHDISIRCLHNHNSKEIIDKMHGAFVFIFTPHRLHYDKIISSIKANAKGVYIEKPVVTSADSWKTIQSLLDQSNTSFWPAYHHFYTSFPKILNNSLGKVSIKNAKAIRINFVRGSVPVREWGSSFTSREYAGGGVLLDIGAHVFSILSTMIYDIHLYEFALKEKLLLKKSEASMLETHVTFNGVINRKCSIHGEIGYDIDNKKVPREIAIELVDSTFISWIEGNLYLNGNMVVDENPQSVLAFKSMFHDFIEGKVPAYIQKILWNIQSIQQIYGHSYLPPEYDK